MDGKDECVGRGDVVAFTNVQWPCALCVCVNVSA